MNAKSGTNQSTKSQVELTKTDVETLMLEVEETLRLAATNETRTEPSDSKAINNGKLPRRAANAVGTAAGVAAGRRAVDAASRKEVIKVARRVASRKTAGMTDTEVLRFLAGNKKFREVTLPGHLHEFLDAKDFATISNLRTRLGLKPSRILELASDPCRPGIDGTYKGARKVGSAIHAQHKLTDSRHQMKNAAVKVDKRVRGKTELVIGRGSGKQAKGDAVAGLKSVREAGRSVKDVKKLVEKAADPRRVQEVGNKAAAQIGVKAVGGSAIIGAGLSVALDLKKRHKGEITNREMLENAAWCGAESGASTLVTAVAVAATADAMAGGVAILAGSSIAGTTTMAAGLAVLGPVGIGIGAGLVIGFAANKLRKELKKETQGR